uniref:Uncharacterized protein n=1 Tax=Ditylenchus dipsaci TaxID=166011 RepID=A0A915E8X5_9BILA
MDPLVRPSAYLFFLYRFDKIDPEVNPSAADLFLRYKLDRIDPEVRPSATDLLARPTSPSNLEASSGNS